jgi:hypothetical protein
MKAVLDKYIQSNYDEVRRYTNYFLVRMNSHIDADTVINNSYLHVLSINDDTACEEKVKSYLLNTIKCQVLWSTSQSNNDDRVTAIEEGKQQDCENTDLEWKIQLEEQYILKKSIIEIYRNSINDRIKQIIFEAYYDKGLTTQKELSQYFNISMTAAHFLIKEIKQGIKEIQYSYDTR